MVEPLESPWSSPLSACLCVLWSDSERGREFERTYGAPVGQAQEELLSRGIVVRSVPDRRTYRPNALGTLGEAEASCESSRCQRRSHGPQAASSKDFQRLCAGITYWVRVLRLVGGSALLHCPNQIWIGASSRARSSALISQSQSMNRSSSTAPCWVKYSRKSFP
jgi:hypothetical protein